MEKVKVVDWERIQYRKAWEQQEILQKDLIEKKRNGGEIYSAENHYFILCEHFPVYTLGRSGKESNLLADLGELANIEAEFVKINRGGDITFHGPGQIVGYPIVDLEFFFRDVHRYIRNIEEVIIKTLSEYDLEAIRMPGYTGVWLPQTDYLPFRKICAIGVHISRWVTLHGFALNVNTDLSYFNHIIPCGIQDENKIVTSLSVELGKEISLAEVKEKLVFNFGKVFECEMVV